MLLIGTTSVKAQGVFEATNAVCDLGTVKAGEPATCEISFTNVGENKANMGAIRPASERIKHNWTSKILEPGESDSFTITVDTEGLETGEFKKSVLLIFDRTKDPITVWVKGNID